MLVSLALIGQQAILLHPAVAQGTAYNSWDIDLHALYSSLSHTHTYCFSVLVALVSPYRSD
jgi:hypothetical protein